MSPSTRRRLPGIALLLALVATLLQPGAASALPAEPGNVAPNGTSTGSNPQLTWDAVTGATSYRVQVAANPAFSPTIVNEVTVNTTHTPASALPNGEIYWRVAAIDGTGTGPYATASFTKDPAAGPELIAPATGAELSFPEEPPTFSWQPTPATKSYILEIDNAMDFIDPTIHKVNSTSFTVVEPIEPGQTYYWRVRGASATGGGGVLTDWSPSPEGRPLTMVWDKAPQLQAPANGATLTDVELRWDPVPGAQYYDLEVSKSVDFAGTHALTVLNSRAVKYAVSPTLNNGAYFWRVRASDGKRHYGPWSETRLFTRGWATKPTLQAPLEGQSVSTLKWDWTPIDHASHYELQVGTDVNFSPGTYKACFTVQDRFSPFDRVSGPAPAPGSCGVSLNIATDTTYFWRVRGIDGSEDVLGLWSDIHTFSWNGLGETATDPFGLVEQVAPVDCTAQVSCATHPSTPTLDWEPVQEAAYYLVYLSWDSNFTTNAGVFTTTQSEFTLRHELLDNTAGQSYYWHVRPCRASDICGPDPVGTAAPSFSFEKRSIPVDLLSPANGTEAVPVEVANQPSFSWQSYLEAQSEVGAPLEAMSYRIQVSTASTFGTLLDNRIVQQTRYTPVALTYPEGPIYWRVAAIDGSENQLVWSEARTFTKKSPDIVPVFPLEDDVVEGTPTFDWEPQLYAVKTEIEVYKNGDTNYSAVNKVLFAGTMHSSYTPPTQSFTPGEYAWRLRRIDADLRAGRWTDGGVFEVEARPITLIQPDQGEAIVTNDLVYAWQGIQDAASYRFQRSATNQFTTVAEQRDTVMTSWAPTVKVPDGTWFWKVQALDSGNNVIGSSPIRSFVKDGNAPLATAIAPTNAIPLSGPVTVTFNEPVTGVSTSNLIVEVTSKSGTVSPIAGRITRPSPTTAAWSPTDPLTPNQIYTITAKAGIEDTYGNNLVPKSWTVRALNVVENPSPVIAYGWDRDEAAAASGGAFIESRQKGSSVTFDFDGTDAVLIGRKAPDGGMVDIYIDDVKVGIANFYGGSTSDKAILFSKTGLSNGKHELEVRTTGTRSASSKGTWARVDAFRSGGVTYEENSPAVRAHWARVDTVKASGGSFDVFGPKKDADGGAAVTFRFRGTSFDWYATRSAKGGMADVLLGKKLIGTIDLYSPTRVDKTRVFAVKDLQDKVQKIRIVPTGKRNPASSGTEVNIDYLYVK